MISLFPCIPPSDHPYLLQPHQASLLRAPCPPRRPARVPLAPCARPTLPSAPGWAQGGSPVPVGGRFLLVSPRAPGTQSHRVVPGGRCLLPLLDWCTRLLNWGKLRVLLFPLLFNEIVNTPTQGKCFCSVQYNARYGAGVSV